MVRTEAEPRQTLAFRSHLGRYLISATVIFVALSVVGGSPIGGAGIGDAHYRQSRFPSIRAPLIGAYYTHYGFPDCGFGDRGILATYQSHRVRAKVHRQLFRMRKRGITSLRIIIWHMTDPGNQRWGVVSSAGGTLREPYRTNLIRFVREVRKYGFGRLSVAFGPKWINNPKAPRFKGGKFQENWRFIQDVRPIVKRYGPKDTRFDLLTEGAPSKYGPKSRFRNLRAYIRRMYANYVTAFGKSDVSVSSLVPREPKDQGNRLQNLIDIFNSTGLGQPNWYEVHLGINWSSDEAFYGLTNSDSVLSQNQQGQPLVIGQVAYNRNGIARAIARFVGNTGRRMDEVLEWYQRDNPGCTVSPPYEADAYKDRLLRRHSRR